MEHLVLILFSLSTILINVFSQNFKCIIIIADFYFNLLECNDAKRRVHNYKNVILSIVKEPTRTTYTCHTLIYNILTNRTNVSHKVHEILDISDHILRSYSLCA